MSRHRFSKLVKSNIVPVHAMSTGGRVEILLRTFLNLPIYGGKLPAFCPSRFIPRKSFPCAHSVERGMCPKTGLEALEKRKICYGYSARRNN